MESEPQTVEDDTALTPAPAPPAALTAVHIQSLPTLAAQAEALWHLPAPERHDALAEMPAPVVAALIEGDPDRNAGLIASLPAAKFQQIAGLGTSGAGPRLAGAGGRVGFARRGHPAVADDGGHAGRDAADRPRLPPRPAQAAELRARRALAAVADDQRVAQEH